MAEVRDELLGHDFDGIKEYDNPMPPWWVNLFFITIVWAILYLLYFHVFQIGDRSVDEYHREYDANWSKSKDPGYNPWSIFPAYRQAYAFNAGIDITPKMMTAAPGASSGLVKREVKKFSLIKDAATLAPGKDIFSKNCISCHGNLGQGGIGPNLTDDYWLHGSGIENVGNTIYYGVTVKGMIAWGQLLKEKEIEQVANYVLSLRGSNPPGAKAPQGDLVK
jgi:cytochrome c oxidase cbb3-type subunit III